MTSISIGRSAREEDSKIFIAAALLAFSLEFSLITLLSWQHTSKLASQSAPEVSHFLEAQVVKMPLEAHLTEVQPRAAAPKETTLSKVPDQGKKSKPGEHEFQEENQTKTGPKLTLTHGPIAVFAPPPVIPSYLQQREFKSSVVIDFFVNALGEVNPRLVGSSGQEELDALAIESVKKWQFRPAQQNGQAIDSKVRLRIVFQVQ